MMQEAAIRKIASRAAANLVAVAAITAIFGLKVLIDQQTGHVLAGRDGDAAVIASAAGYDPYFTEQP